MVLSLLFTDLKISRYHFMSRNSNYNNYDRKKSVTGARVEAADLIVNVTIDKCFFTSSHLLAGSLSLSISNIRSTRPGKLDPAYAFWLLGANIKCLRRNNYNINDMYILYNHIHLNIKYRQQLPN